MRKKKDILDTFFRVGLVQILPVALAILMIIGIMILIYLFTFDAAFQPRSMARNFTVTREDIFKFSTAISISLFLLSGLVSFLSSSFHFIKAKKNNDLNRLSKGLKVLNWGWLTLSIFILGFLLLFVVTL